MKVDNRIDKVVTYTALKVTMVGANGQAVNFRKKANGSV